MKDGNWLPIDKRIISLLPYNREYTFIEAYISFRYDLEENKPYSINGYSKLWGWSRNKVRHFIEGLRTGKGHVVDNQRTGKGQEIRIVFNNLDEPKDKRRTVKGQARDSQEDTTINPNPNNKTIYGEKVKLTDDEFQKLVDKFGEREAIDRMARLDEYLCSKRKHYDSHYHTILTWARKDGWKPESEKKEPKFVY